MPKKSKSPRLEVIELMIQLAEDSAKRDAFFSNRDAFLRTQKIGAKAKKLLVSADQKLMSTLLRADGAKAGGKDGDKLTFVTVWMIGPDIFVSVIITPDD
jgi:hypothetical protein